MSRQMPQKLTANFTTTFLINPSVDNVDAYTYSIALRGAATVDLAGTVEFGKVKFIDSIATSGSYRYTIIATDSSSVRTLLETGNLIVDPDPTAIPDGEDLRTHPEKVLQAIEAVIENRATKDQESMTIAGRTLARTPIRDLLLLRDRYKEEVQQLQKKLPRRVLTTFGNR